MAEGGLFHTGTHGTPDIEVQRGVGVLTGVNKLGTQSRVLAYTIYVQTQVTKGQGVDEDDWEVTTSELTNPAINGCPKRMAVEQARQKIVEWMKCIRSPSPLSEDVEDSD